MLDLLKFVLPIGLLKLSLGGGGGGGGEREATPEEKRLWAAQAGALEGMTEISMPVLQTGMNNLGTLANESMDGTLASRLRGMAGADASAAMGQGLTGATQKLERYGSTINPNALSAEMATTALKGAGLKSSAMNQASMGAEDLKWNRNAALTGLASGQGAQAISGMGSLAQQIGQNRQANMQADAQSMQGLGMAGAWAGNKLFKDGGEVRLANGGGLRSFKPTSVKFAPWEISESDGYKGPSTLDQVGAFATPMAMQAAGNMAAEAISPTLKAGVQGLKNAVGNQVNGLTAVAPEQAGFTAGSEQSAMLAAQDAAFLPEGAAAAGEITAETAAAATGTEAAGAGLMSSVGAALPWVGGALLVGKALDLFADGGEVKGKGLRRKDMTNGGKVKGPGTETSDSIPARLSDGEFVLNAEAVKLVGKDKLDAINNMGLRARGDDVEMAGGGFLYGLGQAARGFVPTAMALDQQDEQKKQWEAQNKRADEQMGLAKSADTRSQQLFNVSMSETNRKIKNRDAISSGVRAGLEKAGPNLSEAKKTFTMLESGFNAARDNGDVDAMFSFMEKMKPAQQALIGDHVGRAYRALNTINDPTARRTAVANELSSIYRFIPDGDDVEGFSVDPDGISFKMKSGATQKYGDDGILNLLRLAQDPKAVMDAEMKGAVERSGKAWEWKNKPMTVGKDETVIVPGTGQTYSPGANRKFDPKDQQAVGDDIRNHALSVHGVFDQTSGKHTWSPKAVQVADTMESLFSNGHALPVTQLRKIAEDGKPGQAQVTVNGKPSTVSGVAFGNNLYLLDGLGTVVPLLGPKAKDAPAVTTGIGTRDVRGKISPRPTPGLTPIAPQTNAAPADFPKVSKEQQAQRDVLAGKLVVDERGSVAARSDLAEIDAALKNTRLNGTQRQILQSERNRIASGLATAG